MENSQCDVLELLGKLSNEARLFLLRYAAWRSLPLTAALREIAYYIANQMEIPNKAILISRSRSSEHSAIPH